MNRMAASQLLLPLSIPRTRGDEPYIAVTIGFENPYSPHPRG